jgi:TRAP-type C4-dicarboxylate transport system substrate-binding protein
MTRLGHLSSAALLAAAVLQAPSAWAATTWDYYSFTGVTHAVTKLQKGFADEVGKRTKGELRIVVRPAGELPYRADEAGRIAGEGLVQMSSAFMGFIAGTIPNAGITGHSFLVRNNDELAKVSAIIEKYTKPEFDKLGVKPLYYFSWGPQNVFGINKPITSAADFANRKIRTNDPKQSEFIKALGGTTITTVTAEVAVAMQRGLMDGLFSATVGMVAAKWVEMVKWAWLADVNVGGPNWELVNLKAYEALPPDVRKSLDEVAAEWGPHMIRELDTLEQQDRASLVPKYKLEVNTASPEVIADLTRRAIPIWEAWAKQTGPKAEEMLKEIRAALNR